MVKRCQSVTVRLSGMLILASSPPLHQCDTSTSVACGRVVSAAGRVRGAGQRLAAGGRCGQLPYAYPYGARWPRLPAVGGHHIHNSLGLHERMNPNQSERRHTSDTHCRQRMFGSE
jgi:hypothetical protein